MKHLTELWKLIKDAITVLRGGESELISSKKWAWIILYMYGSLAIMGLIIASAGCLHMMEATRCKHACPEGYILENLECYCSEEDGSLYRKSP